MAEVFIDGNNYRTGKLNAMTQFHVVRRLLPVVSAFGDIPNDPKTGKPDETQFLPAMIKAVSHLSDDDCEFVIAKCLQVCLRQQGQNWSPVWNMTVNRLQFEDIDMTGMLNLTAATLGENLAGFFPALPQSSTAEASQPNAPLN